MGKKGVKIEKKFLKATKKESEKTKAPSTGAKAGCIRPDGCLISEPIDPNNPGNAVKMNCSNEESKKCHEVLFMHEKCFKGFEDELLKVLDHTGGRCATWTHQIAQTNLWAKKGYEVIFRRCRCPCTGYLRKDLSYHTQDAANAEEDNASESPRKVVKQPKQKLLPKLQQYDNTYGRKLTQAMPRSLDNDAQAEQPQKKKPMDNYIPGLVDKRAKVKKISESDTYTSSMPIHGPPPSSRTRYVPLRDTDEHVAVSRRSARSKSRSICTDTSEELLPSSASSFSALSKMDDPRFEFPLYGNDSDNGRTSKTQLRSDANFDETYIDTGDFGDFLKDGYKPGASLEHRLFADASVYKSAKETFSDWNRALNELSLIGSDEMFWIDYSPDQFSPINTWLNSVSRSSSEEREQDRNYFNRFHNDSSETWTSDRGCAVSSGNKSGRSEIRKDQWDTIYKNTLLALQEMDHSM